MGEVEGKVGEGICVIFIVTGIMFIKIKEGYLLSWRANGCLFHVF